MQQFFSRLPCVVNSPQRVTVGRCQLHRLWKAGLAGHRQPPPEKGRRCPWAFSFFCVNGQAKRGAFNMQGLNYPWVTFLWC